MVKRVLDVGNCEPDHRAIRRLIEESFAASVLQAHGLEDTLETLRGGDIDLILVNRKLDQDYSDGLDIIRAIKQDADVGDVPVMMITNFPEHQQLAVEAGAEPGFGKLEFANSETHQKLRRVLGDA